jgi:hypothetical protein
MELAAVEDTPEKLPNTEARPLAETEAPKLAALVVARDPLAAGGA